MKIGIYSPYLDTAGGGERYMLTIAETFSKEHEANVFLDKNLFGLNINEIIEKNSTLLGLDLRKVNFIPAPFGEGSSSFERLKFLRSYDLLFYLTDGSIFYSTAKKSILHIQSPIKVKNTSFWKKIKKSSWSLIIYNSNFTKSYSENYWGLGGKVIYPPVDIKSLRPGLKKKKILTVGRFSEFQTDKNVFFSPKKHEILIESFKHIHDSKKIPGWSLHLAGSIQQGDDGYIRRLERLSEGYPIFIHPNLSFDNLKNLYQESLIYWHAAGYSENDPTKMEHFGITTVEAMASGCVPVVINLGGQKEIVDDNLSGFLWNEPFELEKLTLKLVEQDKLREKMSLEAVKKAKEFSKETFTSKILGLI